MANNHNIAVIAERERQATSADLPLLQLTQTESDDLTLLSYSLGSGRNACINFATKYVCSIYLHSKMDLKLPNPLKPSKLNPPAPVEFGLNPEVLASLRAVRAQRKELRGLSDAEISKRALFYFCKKLLPPKKKRILHEQLSKRGVS